MNGIIDGLIDDARQRSEVRRAPMEHIRRRREEATARVAGLAREYLSSAESEGEVNERLKKIRHIVDYVQDERISTAEAMVSMVVNGYWDGEPFWINIQDDNGLQWKGYVHRGDITAYTVQDYQIGNFLHSVVQDVDLSVKVLRLCSGGSLAYATIVRQDGVRIRHVVFNDTPILDENREVHGLMVALFRRVFFWVGDDAIISFIHSLKRN